MFKTRPFQVVITACKLVIHSQTLTINVLFFVRSNLSFFWMLLIHELSTIKLRLTHAFMRRQTSVNMQVLSVSPNDRPSVLIKQ